ncbi:MAG: tripartite tricarboxylate transporter TctB family protein [Clostridium sp.]|nr:tripartite tricarboxylate transporter TctB family protein [Clostridium sp.]MDY5484910.1 tripartite tricarboxylate transporter TctB family protein [Clostridium sp.]
MKTRKMIKGEKMCVRILLLVSLLTFGAALQLFLKNPGVANQGTFPLAAASVMVLSSLIMVGEMRYLSPSFEKEGRKDRIRETVKELFPDRMAPVILMVVVYAAALSIVGFAIATFFFLFLLMLLLKAGKWLRCVVISAGVVVGILCIFQFIFHVVLP